MLIIEKGRQMGISALVAKMTGGRVKTTVTMKPVRHKYWVKQGFGEWFIYRDEAFVARYSSYQAAEIVAARLNEVYDRYN